MKKIFSDLVIDSSGIDSCFRKEVAKIFNITGQLDDNDVFTVYRAFVKTADGEKLPENHKKKVYSSSVQFGLNQAKQAQKFHQSFPEYQPTPLVQLYHLAKKLNVAGIYVKDESYRFGLNAFKVLGGSYAIGRYIQKHLNLQPEEFNYDTLIKSC